MVRGPWSVGFVASLWSNGPDGHPQGHFAHAAAEVIGGFEADFVFADVVALVPQARGQSERVGRPSPMTIISWAITAAWTDWIVSSCPPSRLPPVASTPPTLFDSAKLFLRNTIQRSRNALHSDDMLAK